MARRRTDDEPHVRRVEVMADYSAFPLWGSPDGSDGPGHAIGALEPEDLPVSAELVAALREWAEVYERLPATDFRWPSPEAHAVWNEQGRALARRVRRELPDHEVVFFDELAGEVVDPDRPPRRRP